MENMEKAGILTFHNAENYGASLQSLALQEFISQNGVFCQIIDYRNLGVTKRNLIKNFYYLVTLQNPIKNIIEYRTFRNHFFNQTKKKYHSLKSFQEDANSFDYFFLGSDQIWNPELSNGFDEIYFGAFKTNAKKIAYSASFGKDHISQSELSKINRYLKNFDAISVRENDLIKSLQGDIYCTLDPCFLLRKEEWDTLIHNTERKKDYLFSYQLHLNGQIRNMVNSIARGFNKETLLISPDIFYDHKVFKKLPHLDPLRFLWYLRNADFVVTDSFHGTVFSIIFQKEFFVTLPPQKRGRIVSLLRRLGLTDRILYNNSDVNNLFSRTSQKIDFDKVFELLNPEIAFSSEFIKKNLA